MKNWTQNSAEDFAYSLSLDFFTDLEDRLEESSMNRKQYADRLQLTPGRVSQMFNTPPENPTLSRLVEYARALGLKVSVIAYDDGDPDGNEGPVYSGIFTRCWELAQRPRDLLDLEGEHASAVSSSATCNKIDTVQRTEYAVEKPTAVPSQCTIRSAYPNHSNRSFNQRPMRPNTIRGEVHV